MYKVEKPIIAALNNLLEEMKIMMRTLASAQYFRALKGKKGLKIHLGCDYDIRIGWINIDCTPKPIPYGAKLVLHDLRLGLPLDNDSCSIIYSSHFFEHLEYKYALQLLHECYRVLQPGGIFRIALPNLKEIFAAYLRGDHKYLELLDICKELPDLEPGTETLVDYVNYAVYQRDEHRYIYDEDKLILLLHRVGYSSVISSLYKEDIDPSTPQRLRYTFYVEAIKQL